MQKSNSLMVVLEGDEYCFLYDRPSFPELLESLLEFKTPPEEEVPGLDSEQAREIARELIGQAHRDL